MYAKGNWGHVADLVKVVYSFRQVLNIFCFMVILCFALFYEYKLLWIMCSKKFGFNLMQLLGIFMEFSGNILIPKFIVSSMVNSVKAQRPGWFSFDTMESWKRWICEIYTHYSTHYPVINTHFPNNTNTLSPKWYTLRRWLIWGCNSEVFLLCMFISLFGLKPKMEFLRLHLPNFSHSESLL